MNYIGIDPGKAGGIAVLWEDGTATAWDLPDDEVSLAKLFANEATAGYQPRFLRCALEKQQARPPNGRIGCFNIGVSYGMVRGALACFSISTRFVSPRTWQTIFDNRKKDEDIKLTSLKMARRLFPTVDLHRKKDNGKSDALLIALWLKKQEAS